MEFSNRDSRQSGQAVIEYLLILIVAVSIILGGLYQLNSAFKVWATNYFGNYLACLLETGEMPSGGGEGGGLCNQFFKQFSIADGRPLIGDRPPGEEGGGDDGRNPRGGGNKGAASEQAAYRAGGYSSSGGAFGRMGGRSQRSPGAGKRSKLKGGETATNTGSTEASSYGNGNYSSRKERPRFVRRRLDNRFAFEEEKKEEVKRKAAGSVKKKEEGGSEKRSLLRRKDLVKDTEIEEGEPMTFAGFIRFLIIAAILIAMVMFLGGQALQIGKSMDNQ